ncbi:MAG: hypothetical protein ACI9G1_004822 [Pirellulaceae bacterium]|jgi:hypothetical protein
MSAETPAGWFNYARLRVSGFFRSGQVRLLLCLLTLVVFGALAIYGWQKWGQDVLDRDNYRVTADRLIIPSQPPWVANDIRKQVVQDASLLELSTLEHGTSLRIQQAFELHPWVRSANNVHAQSDGTVLVDVEYRRPVGMVQTRLGGVQGLLPIDRDGCLLPSDDFTPQSARNYLKFDCGDTTPTGMIGGVWEDLRVIGAAKIASLLVDDWKALGLYKVSATRKSTHAAPVFHLQTRGKVFVYWGHAPGMEVVGEAKANRKVLGLISYVEKNGPIDSSAKTELDLRGGVIKVSPLTALRNSTSRSQ